VNPKTVLKTNRYYPINMSTLNPTSVYKPQPSTPQRYRSTIGMVFTAVRQVQTHNFGFICYIYVPSTNSKITHPLTASPQKTGIYQSTNKSARHKIGFIFTACSFSSPLWSTSVLKDSYSLESNSSNWVEMNVVWNRFAQCLADNSRYPWHSESN